MIWEEAGEEFNIASNPQLRVVLFEKLGLPARIGHLGVGERRAAALRARPTAAR